LAALPFDPCAFISGDRFRNQAKGRLIRSEMLAEVGLGEVRLIGCIGDNFQAGERREAAANLLG
jgi:hypothetical protein